MALTLTRRPGQSIELRNTVVADEGDVIDAVLTFPARIRVQRVRGGAVTLVLDVADQVKVTRGEILDRPRPLAKEED